MIEAFAVYLLGGLLSGVVATWWMWKLMAPSRRRGHCPECDYPAAGLQQGARCPECGFLDKPLPRLGVHDFAKGMAIVISAPLMAWVAIGIYAATATPLTTHFAFSCAPAMIVFTCWAVLCVVHRALAFATLLLLLAAAIYFGGIGFVLSETDWSDIESRSIARGTAILVLPVIGWVAIIVAGAAYLSTILSPQQEHSK